MNRLGENTVLSGIQNRKPTKWLARLECRTQWTAQLANLCTHSSRMSFVLISRQTIAQLFDSLTTGLVLRTFMQYSVTYCSRSEAASGVISGTFLSHVGPDKVEKFRNHVLNRSREVRLHVAGDGILKVFFSRKHPTGSSW